MLPEVVGVHGFAADLAGVLAHLLQLVRVDLLLLQTKEFEF